MALIKGFLLGLTFSLLVAVLYASYAKHPVRCLWCNQPAEYKTCLEMAFGHTDVVHMRNGSGRLCMDELAEAIRQINLHLGRDESGTSINDFKRTLRYGSEHQSKERTIGPQEADHRGSGRLDD